MAIRSRNRSGHSAIIFRSSLWRRTTPGGWIRRVVLSVLASTILACGGSPDAATQNPALNLTGTWSGVVGAGSGRRQSVTRDLDSQSDRRQSFRTSHAPDLACSDGRHVFRSSDWNAHGQSALPDLRDHAGAVPGSANCSASGTGLATATSSAISGNLMSLSSPVTVWASNRRLTIS